MGEMKSDSMDSRVEKVVVTRRTKDGAVRYRGFSSETLEVRFSKTRNHVYLPDGRVLRKVKGGHKGGVMAGQYEGVEDGDMYDIMVVGQ